MRLRGPTKSEVYNWTYIILDERSGWKTQRLTRYHILSIDIYYQVGLIWHVRVCQCNHLVVLYLLYNTIASVSSEYGCIDDRWSVSISVVQNYTTVSIYTPSRRDETGRNRRPEIEDSQHEGYGQIRTVVLNKAKPAQPKDQDQNQHLSTRTGNIWSDGQFMHYRTTRTVLYSISRTYPYLPLVARGRPW